MVRLRLVEVVLVFVVLVFMSEIVSVERIV